MKTRILILLIALFLPVSAQQQRGTITGRVVTDEGTPLSGVTVMLASYNGSASPSTLKRALTDQEGNFQFTNLAAHSYTINVTETLGYVAPSYPPNVPRPVYRIGENVTLRLTRGGVITGRVTYANGDPMIGVYVSAIRIRDANGAPINIQSPFLARMTDDRGVYRVYGVSAGTYVVAVNQGGAIFYGQQTPFDGDAPTYYPSATRDTAVEIQVQTGIESSGIDIRHRSERGFAVSGKITGGSESTGPRSFAASAIIRTFPTGLNAGIAIAESGTGGFSFLGLPDGEYELVAEMGSSDSDGNQLSEPRRVAVRGSDVTGIELRLMPMASIAGKVVLEPSPNVCDPKAKSSLEELTLISRREEKPTDSPALLQRYQVVLAPDDKGEFKLNRLAAGRYRIETNLPGENWFVKAISSGASAASPARAGTSTAATKPANTTDLAKLGALLKSGERLTGVTFTIADGAASLRGKIAPAKDGGKLPSRLRVFLVPAEATATDDVLRYGEALTSDGSFVFTNFAPGKYWLLAKPVADAEPTDRMPSPVAWDAAERLKLRKAAEAAKTEIELKPCQRVKDHVLRY